MLSFDTLCTRFLVARRLFDLRGVGLAGIVGGMPLPAQMLRLGTLGDAAENAVDELRALVAAE
jgi:hypothetical protein